MLSACTPAKPPPPDALVGTWTGELKRGPLPLWVPGGTRIPVRLVLAPVPRETRCGDSREVCESRVTGSYTPRIPGPWGGRVEPGIEGAILEGRALFMLGGCCDRGEVVMSGDIADGTIRGSWYHQTVGAEPGGHFVLRRPAPARR